MIHRPTAAALLALLVSLTAGANSPPEEPDLTGIDLQPALDAFGDLVDELEDDLNEATTRIEALVDRAQDVAENPEDEPLVCIAPLGTVFIGAFVSSLAAPPPLDLALDIVGYGADIGLKFCRPRLTVSDPIAAGFDPADDGGDDDCRLEVDQLLEATNTSFLVFPRGGGLLEPRPDDWGPLGTPETLHVNSDVDVRLSGVRPEDDGASLGLGMHTLTWEAITTISPLDLVFLYIPGLPEGAKRYLGAKGPDVLELLIDIAVEIGLFELGAGESENAFLRRIQTGQPNSAPTRMTRGATVWDLVPPVITSASGEDIIEFEGLEPGGASIKTQRERLEALIDVSDACRRPEDLELVAPGNFWPVDQVSDAVWTVFDPGPNRAGERNSASVTQRVRVVDTLPPEVVAPPSQVAELPGGQARSYVQIGAPRTFDLVDIDPEITATFVPTDGVVQVDGGFEFPPGVTEIQWCARDGSGNDSCAEGVDTLATQVINVKEAGTNTPPVANSALGAGAFAAESFEPIEITVSGSDPDFDPRSGRFDPLGFDISKQPENGFFVAPLLPFFIEDYRIPYGDAIDRCTPGRPPEVIVEPQNLRVSESGMMFVLGAPLTVEPGCSTTDPFFFLAENRLSVFETNGDSERYVTGRDLPRAQDLFGFYFDERRNRILYTTFENRRARILELDPATLETIRTYTFAERPDSIRKAVIDGEGVLYTSTGFARVNVWDTRLAPCVADVCTLDDAQIATFEYLPEELAGGGTGVPIDLALTADDSLLIGTFNHIYRYRPATRDDQGDAVPGELVGFLGACSAGAGCDLVTEATRGFSCTHETCEALYPRPGLTPPILSDGPGQLNQAHSLALDPNDNLYVADRNNDRVQRFTPEGFYAGEAKSSCDDDIDRCLQEGFVLANFSRPDTISVNSRHLYVLDPDPDLELVHVFQTSVLTPISDSEATITYVADSGFEGVDHFEFEVSDGLAVSAPAVVEIDVTLTNQFAPSAGDLAVQGREDEPLAITLAGTDPDFGPDALAFEILTPPGNGTLMASPGAGSGALRTYQPRADWFGTDSFTYRADDGDFASEPATVTITVEPVGDSPVLDLPPRFEAKLDERSNISFSFSDADPGSEHTVEIDWGDGTVEREGEVLEDGTTTGPLLSETRADAGPVSGFVSAFHRYGPPAREVELVACILPPTTTLGKGEAPAPEFVCESATVEVGILVFRNGFE